MPVRKSFSKRNNRSSPNRRSSSLSSPLSISSSSSPSSSQSSSSFSCPSPIQQQQQRSSCSQNSATTTSTMATAAAASWKSTMTTSKNNNNNNNNNQNNVNNNNTTKKRTRKMAPPPARLAWPGQIAVSSQNSSQNNQCLSLQQSEDLQQQPQPQQQQQVVAGTLSSTNASPKQLGRKNNKTAAGTTSTTISTKRPRSMEQTEEEKKKKKKNDQEISSSPLLWIEKHCPTQSSDLVVAPKKVKQVVAWLQHQQQKQGLLLLVGAPGMGKSTLVRVLGAEENFELVEWTESFYQFQQQQQQQQQTGGGIAAASMEFQTPLQHWQQFMRQNSIGYSSLEMEEEEEESPHSLFTSSLLSQSNQTHCRPRKQQKQQQKRRLIVVDELPYCHTSEQKEQMKETLTNHILHSRVPTIWIWSHNVLEGKQYNPADLEELVDPLILYNTHLVTFCTVNPPTLARFQATLKRMAQHERISIGTTLTQSWIPEMHVKSGGDIRFAIHALQYEFGSYPSSKPGHNDTIRKDSSQTKVLQHERDVRLSTFHALGKVLYAKRKKNVSKDEYIGGEAPLDFDPEAAMEHSGMELSGSIHFIQYHSLDFFTDVSEVSVAWDLYSDAAQLLDSFPLFHQEESVSWSAASSLAGRAVSYSNHNPAPTKFRQFSKPKSFDVMTQRKANQWRLDQYYRTAASMRFQHSRQAFATDIYPYGRRIFESQATQRRQRSLDLLDDEDNDDDWQHTTSSFWGGPPLQSFLSAVGGGDPSSLSSSHSIRMVAPNEEEDALKQKEQEEVLAQDDIIDDFDDGSQ